MMLYNRGLDGLLRQTRIEMIPKPGPLSERKARWDLELLSKNQVQIQVTVIPTGRRDHSPRTEDGLCRVLTRTPRTIRAMGE